jgi:hypothetical protein
MQDNNEKTIMANGERIEKMMHEREEGGGWELNSKDVDGFHMSMYVTPRGSTSHLSQGIEHKNLRRKKHGHPLSRLPL